MWTARALGSERRGLAGAAWRIVESQARIATMKLVDSLAEQELLEAALERSKPPVPPECARLHWLLATPFRYAPYPHGSRFRRARQPEGCLYAAEQIETAVAEDAFYRLLFFLDAPTAKRPRNPQERTAFGLRLATQAALDLTLPPLSRNARSWTHPTEYAPCQALADTARAAGVAVLRYRSVRDPRGGANLAVLDCRAITSRQPLAPQTWHVLLRSDRVEAMCEMPRLRLSFALADWAATDPRVPARLP